ncbi:MAG: hypothetical protein GF311_04615 [Candidatus Lokiarchaeota archaeon]|nr:hypothetical protein [Candidatus Lokiarchaeota archaeon]
MSEIIKQILIELGPCAVNEALDYIRSGFFLQKGNLSLEEWTYSKLKYHFDKIIEENKVLFKFNCDSGYQVRYGPTKFEYYLLEEPRYLRESGYLKRCMFCGMPIYINGRKVFHFRYNCKQYIPQKYYHLLKIDNFFAIISRDFIYGILDDLQSCKIRLPSYNQIESSENVQSELWLINKIARERELIEPDRLLSLRAEEYIT